MYTNPDITFMMSSWTKIIGEAVAPIFAQIERESWFFY